MTAKIENGDLVLDSNGNLIEISGREEILQRAYFRLMAHYGEFELDPTFGSELYKMDLSSASEDMLFAYVLEVLMPIEEIEVTGVEKSIPDENGQIILTIYLRVLSENAILEIKTNTQS